jgi:hypothetical protein
MTFRAPADELVVFNDAVNRVQRTLELIRREARLHSKKYNEAVLPRWHPQSDPG